jgi:hypothetical protein
LHVSPAGKLPSVPYSEDNHSDGGAWPSLVWGMRNS